MAASLPGSAQGTTRIKAIMSNKTCKHCGHGESLHMGYGKECMVATEKDEGGEDLLCECPGYEEA